MERTAPPISSHLCLSELRWRRHSLVTSTSASFPNTILMMMMMTVWIGPLEGQVFGLLKKNFTCMPLGHWLTLRFLIQTYWSFGRFVITCYIMTLNNSLPHSLNMTNSQQSFSSPWITSPYRHHWFQLNTHFLLQLKPTHLIKTASAPFWWRHCKCSSSLYAKMPWTSCLIFWCMRRTLGQMTSRTFF